MSNYISNDKYEAVLENLQDGYSIREVARAVHVAVGTVLRARASLLETIADLEKYDPCDEGWGLKCPCGREGGHRGWCSWRLKRSPARRAVLRRMHASQGGGSAVSQTSESIEGNDILQLKYIRGAR